MTHQEIIKALRAANPYPEKVFREPTDEEWQDVNIAIEGGTGRPPDRYFGSWGRHVWALCCSELEELLKDAQPTDSDIYEALGKTSDYDAKYLKLGKDAQILRPSEVVEAVRLLLTKQKTETDENKENLLN